MYEDEDYPVYIVMKSKESDEAVALINVRKRDDDRYASREIQDMYRKVYKFEEISEAQFETFELFGVPSALPLDMTFLLLESSDEFGRTEENVQERLDNLRARWEKWGS